LTVHELRKAREPELEEAERTRVEAEKGAVKKVEPEAKEPETSEEFEAAAKTLKRKAGELKTPEQKLEEKREKARKSLHIISFE